MGGHNPITLHSVNEDLFAYMWSLIAETMVPELQFTRYTKESIAMLVSQKNDCPMCVTAHRMMSIAAERAESVLHHSAHGKYNQQRITNAQGKTITVCPECSHQCRRHSYAMAYAEQIIEQSMICRKENFLGGEQGRESATSSRDDDHNNIPLHEKEKAEIALIVLLFFHMNRSVSALLGEQLSTAMLRVPRPVASRMERDGPMRFMSKLMAPFMASRVRNNLYPPGMISSKLFATSTSDSCDDYVATMDHPNNKDKEDSDDSTTNADADDQRDDNAPSSATSSSSSLSFEDIVPEHLQGIRLAGEERAKAVVRLLRWTEDLYQTNATLHGIVSPAMLEFLDHPQNTKPPADLPPYEICRWATSVVRNCDFTANAATTPTQRAVATVLFLVSVAPQCVFGSPYWKHMVEALEGGESFARTTVLWWSLRFTLRNAKGLSLSK